MGMNAPGEIATLTNIAKPTIGVITNVGTAHIGKLGSRENILKAKLEILEGMGENATLIINNDNDLLYSWNKENKTDNVKTFGIENQSDVLGKDVKLKEYASKFKAEIKQEEIDIEVPIGGIHFVYNALCAITVGKTLGIENQKILQGIKVFELSKNRMELIENSNGIKIISDCYNANYDSMKAALQSLQKLNASRKVAMLGDMLELGEFSKQLHEKVGEEVVKNKIDLLVTVGEESKHIIRKAKDLGMKEELIYENDTLEEAIQILEELLKPDDAVLIKASNGMKFNKIVEAIKNNEKEIVANE